MTRRHAATPLPHRWVLALLAVLASFAFLTREVGAVPDPGVPSVHAGMAGHAGMGGPHAMTTPAGPASPRPAGTHDHAAHCPFCFTAAFALAAAAPGAPAALIQGTAAPDLVVLHAGRPAGRHADARAPPVA